MLLMNSDNTTMKDSQALVKPVLLAAICLCFLLLQTCYEKKHARPEIVQEPTYIAKLSPAVVPGKTAMACYRL